MEEVPEGVNYYEMPNWDIYVYTFSKQYLKVLLYPKHVNDVIINVEFRSVLFFLGIFENIRYWMQILFHLMTMQHYSLLFCNNLIDHYSESYRWQLTDLRANVVRQKQHLFVSGQPSNIACIKSLLWKLHSSWLIYKTNSH